MKKRIFAISALFIALLFWCFDSFIHFLTEDGARFELIPQDFSELWMRAIIVVLILILGMVADYFTNEILFREKQLEVARVYNGVIHASCGILGNLLKELELFKQEAQKCKGFDDGTLKLFHNTIGEVSLLIDRLTAIEDITDRNLGNTKDR